LPQPQVIQAIAAQGVAYQGPALQGVAIYGFILADSGQHPASGISGQKKRRAERLVAAKPLELELRGAVQHCQLGLAARHLL